ncbi:MAG: hypothetical protein AAF311_12905, partial [Pseudomonadota bacterium]
ALVIGTAVAGSLAFGLGGRDWAGQVLQKIFPPKDMNKPETKTPAKPAARKVPVKPKTPPKL